jgi:hypothetical protein
MSTVRLPGWSWGLLRVIAVGFVLGGCSSAAPAAATSPATAPPSAPSPAVESQPEAFDHQHSTLGAVLGTHVSDGVVAYGALAADRGALDGYLASLAALSPEELDGFSREQAMALWINAYNASTVRLILDNGPLASIRDIDEPWDKPTFAVAGQDVSLNHIEHEILRKQYPDARLHMVLVCAARSCPNLQSHAYVAERLGEQMDGASRAFVGDDQRNRFDASAGVLRVSRIFEWYGSDFVSQYAQRGGGGDEAAAIRGFFSSFSADDTVASPDVTVEWLEYDWALNGSF